MKPAILALEDGSIFQGRSFGFDGETTGEVIFNTAMMGYQEVLTDPSYRRQIVTMTYPLIGNYGINYEDFESDKIQVSGLVVGEYARNPSNHRSKKTLQDFLIENNIVAIEGVDTRALTRRLRNNGSLRGIISTKNLDPESLKEKALKIPSMDGLDLASEVTTKDVVRHSRCKVTTVDIKEVALIDFGVKQSIIRQLNLHGCNVTVFPASVSADEIIKFNPDGILLSNGPGDPAAVKYAIETIKSLLGKFPIFGICLGHQLLALALCSKTHKMKFGHHGANHPVKDLETGHITITTQNHGFCVDPGSLTSDVNITHINLNDQSVEGISSPENRCFSVQYHPEAAPGPEDNRYLFKKFLNLMERQL